LAAYRGLKGFRGEASLSTWLYRIALRSAATIKAKANRDVDLPADLLASTPGPDEAAEGRIQVERLTWALRRLSAEQQAILSLFAIDGISHIQIAEILGVPEGTVWSRLHGARKRLLEEIGAGNSRS
jgi:RNA polymerase sigma-70 factor (ECF subfamily)